MQRVLTTVTLLGLLVATAAAFAITEHLKLIKSPIYGTQVTKLISPVCRCATAHATIRVRLRHADRLTVTIENASKQTVATLATDVSESRGYVSFPWDGRTDAGDVAPDGRYWPQIHLAAARRTILLPNPITVDTVAPKVLSAGVEHRAFSPAGHHTIALHYAFDEPAHAAVYLDGRRLILGHATRPRSAVNWSGRAHGRELPAGRYLLSIGAVDLAGNVTPAAERKTVVVAIRYIELAQARIRVRPGRRFSVGVATGAKRYRWRLAGRHGTAHGKLLRLRAPKKRGRYRLVVTEQGHSARAIVIVGSG